jgi:hypothetical protein
MTYLNNTICLAQQTPRALDSSAISHNLLNGLSLYTPSSSTIFNAPSFTKLVMPFQTPIQETAQDLRHFNVVSLQAPKGAPAANPNVLVLPAPTTAAPSSASYAVVPFQAETVNADLLNTLPVNLRQDADIQAIIAMMASQAALQSQNKGLVSLLENKVQAVRGTLVSLQDQERSLVASAPTVTLTAEDAKKRMFDLIKLAKKNGNFITASTEQAQNLLSGQASQAPVTPAANDQLVVSANTPTSRKEEICAVQTQIKETESELSTAAKELKTQQDLYAANELKMKELNERLKAKIQEKREANKALEADISNLEALLAQYS